MGEAAGSTCGAGCELRMLLEHVSRAAHRGHDRGAAWSQSKEQVAWRVWTRGDLRSSGAD
jgi:hypothetical protein